MVRIRVRAPFTVKPQRLLDVGAFLLGEALTGSLSLAIDKFCIIDTITEARRLA